MTNNISTVTRQNPKYNLFSLFRLFKFTLNKCVQLSLSMGSLLILPPAFFYFFPINLTFHIFYIVLMQEMRQHHPLRISAMGFCPLA